MGTEHKKEQSACFCVPGKHEDAKQSWLMLAGCGDVEVPLNQRRYGPKRSAIQRKDTRNKGLTSN
jgi:hypothetical protein